VLSHLNAEREDRESDLPAMFSRSGGQEAREERWAREKEREERRTASDPVLVISGLG